MSVTEDDFEGAELRKAGLSLTASRSFEAGPSYGFADEVEHRPDVLARRAVEDALNSSVDVMVESIAQSIDADGSGQGGPTQGITLCGGTARLPGLKARIQQRTGVPVLIGKPWVRVERSRHNALHLPGGQEDPVKVMNLAVAVGLALWKEPT
jgi:Tfp pilus assembly PilM family ATPase